MSAPGIVDMVDIVKLQSENLQLKIKICELTSNLAKAEAHIFALELRKLEDAQVDVSHKDTDSVCAA